MQRFAAVLVLVLSVPAWAQDGLTVAGPSSPVGANRLARLSLAGVEPESVYWEVVPLSGRLAEEGGTVDAEPADRHGPTLAFPAPPGRYRVLAFAVTKGQAKYVRAVPFEVTFAGDGGEVPDRPDDGMAGATSAMRAEGREFGRASGEVLRQLALWVRQNPESNKLALREELRRRQGIVGERFLQAIDAAVDPHVEKPSGDFLKPAAIAKALDEAGRGVGSP